MHRELQSRSSFLSTTLGVASPSTAVMSLPKHAHRGRTLNAVRDTIVTVVLGGELAVPCTRNPLQRG